MNMKVTIRENRPIEFTYWISGVNSIEEGKRAAVHCYETHIGSENCYLGRTVPCSRTIEMGTVEITNPS